MEQETLLALSIYGRLIAMVSLTVQAWGKEKAANTALVLGMVATKGGVAPEGRVLGK